MLAIYTSYVSKFKVSTGKNYTDIDSIVSADLKSNDDDRDNNGKKQTFDEFITKKNEKLDLSLLKDKSAKFVGVRKDGKKVFE